MCLHLGSLSLVTNVLRGNDGQRIIPWFLIRGWCVASVPPEPLLVCLLFVLPRVLLPIPLFPLLPLLG